MSDATFQKHGRALQAFLFSHREPTMPLKTWLSDLRDVCLDEAFRTRLREELPEFARLLSECEASGTLAQSTVGSFVLQGGSPKHLNLITLHSAKGLQYEVVVLFGMEEGILPSASALRMGDIASERRLFYVGLTRARYEVHITNSGWFVNSYNEERRLGVSRFVGELEELLRQDDASDELSEPDVP
jgi:DNA helicase-2/ATP-dependent DNA helicase PcrA